MIGSSNLCWDEEKEKEKKTVERIIFLFSFELKFQQKEKNKKNKKNKKTKKQKNKKTKKQKNKRQKKTHVLYLSRNSSNLFAFNAPTGFLKSR